MIDGLYQSVICFYLPYLLFEPATFNTESGRDVGDYKRIGVYIATPTVFVVNVYILLNTYRWDWFMCLITAISVLLVWFWTGVYTAFTAGFTFYEAATQVYGQLSFWVSCLMVIILCLLPRFAIKSYQKIYLPYDVDIIREQIRQGKFDYLKDIDPAKVAPAPEKAQVESSASSSSISKPSRDLRKASHTANHVNEDERPIYPPSVAPTATTHNPRSQNGSDGTDYTGHRGSLDRAFPPTTRPHSFATAPQTPQTPTMEINGEALDDTTRMSVEKPRPSFDRLRSSMDRTRPSFEASRDFTSAAYLARVESNMSQAESHSRSRERSAPARREDISDDLRR